MNRRNRLVLSIAIPVLLLVIIGGLYLHQQQVAAKQESLARGGPDLELE